MGSKDKMEQDGGPGFELTGITYVINNAGFG